MSKGILSVKRKKRWEWKRGDGKIALTTPNVLFVMSPWGNQLYKFALFMQDWCDKIDILSSVYDLLKIENTKKGKEWKKRGINNFFKWLRREYLRYFNEKQQNLDYYRHYLAYLSDHNSRAHSFNRFFMLDSGGYTFRSRKNISKSGLEPLFSQGVEKISRHIFNKQISFKPSAIITLDKPIDDLRAPLSEKKKSYEFSLRSAKMYLVYKKELEESGISCPLIFAAVQHYGRNLSCHDYQLYEKTVKEYVSSLIDWEEKIGAYFSGFSVGSLIPVRDYNLIKVIGRSVVEVLRERGRRKDVVLHALGISNRRAEILLQEGFDLFDTNKPMKLARFKLYYHPIEGKPIKIQDMDELPCSCIVCRNHPISHFKEKRDGLKEVSTVLLALHNYYVLYS